MQPLRIFGAGISAAKAVDLIRWELSTDFAVEGFYDDRCPAGAQGPGGYPILGNVAQGLEYVSTQKAPAFLALGTKASAICAGLFLDLLSAGVPLPSLIARSARISPSAKIGLNSIVFPGVYIGCEVEMGHLLNANAAAVIEHHAKVGHNVLVGASATIGAASNVGSHSFIGIGAVTAPEVLLGRGCLVGAGSVVMGELRAHAVALGYPARVLRQVRPDDEVPVREDVERLTERGLP